MIINIIIMIIISRSSSRKVVVVGLHTCEENAMSLVLLRVRVQPGASVRAVDAKRLLIESLRVTRGVKRRVNARFRAIFHDSSSLNLPGV